MIRTIKDYEYDLNKACDIKSALYANVKNLTPIFRHPFFNLKDCQCCVPDLTYRRINDWDRKKLITGSRINKKAGWRKFSPVDIVKLSIISDLRKLGLGIKNIKSIISKISSTYADTNATGSKKAKFQQLEYFMACSMLKKKILLLIDETQNVSFFPTKEAIKYHFKFDKAQDPVLILPFFLYVKKISKRPKKNYG
jgi:DNA-binding transcriptional MerR regulator